MKYNETSAKTAFNINESFHTMTKDIISLSTEKDKSIKKGFIQLIFIFFNKILDDKGIKIADKNKFENIQKKGES